MTTSVFSLKASSRAILGSSESRRIRKSGMIPAIIYNKGGNNISITVNCKEFEKEYFKGHIFTTLVDLEFDGKNIKVIPYKVDLNPVTDRPTHIDFVKVEKDKPVKAKVKLRFIGNDKSPGLKKGGFLHVVLRKIELLCNLDSIPQFIDINTSLMQVGSKVRAKDLKLPDGVSVAAKNNFIVCSIIGRGSKDDQESVAAVTDSASGTDQPATTSKAAPAAKAPAAKAAGGDSKGGGKK